MVDYTYHIHDVESGTHILIYSDMGDGYKFERKVFVPNAEFRPETLACVMTQGFEALYVSSHKFVVDWIKRNRDDQSIKMVGVGEDFQIFGISEYLFHYT